MISVHSCASTWGITLVSGLVRIIQNHDKHSKPDPWTACLQYTVLPTVKSADQKKLAKDTYRSLSLH